MYAAHSRQRPAGAESGFRHPAQGRPFAIRTETRKRRRAQSARDVEPIPFPNALSSQRPASQATTDDRHTEIGNIRARQISPDQRAARAPGLIDEAPNDPIEDGQRHRRWGTKTEQRTDRLSSHRRQIRQVHRQGLSTNRARCLATKEKMYAFDLSVHREDEFISRSGSQDRGIIADPERPRLAGRMASAPCDSSDQGGFAEIGQGALTSGHAPSVERVRQSCFDAWAGVDGPEEAVFRAVRSLDFKPRGSTST